MKNLLTNYLDKIHRKLKTEVATEHSYRSTLENFFTDIATHLDKKECHVINESKRSAFGVPDLFVKTDDIDLGFIEAKDLHFSLDDVENSTQLIKYRGALENLILTNHLEFRYYQRGELKQSVSFGRVIQTADEHSRGKKKKSYDIELYDLDDLRILDFTHIVNQFFDYAEYDFAYILTAKDLAKKMAQKAILISEICQQCLIAENDKQKSKNSKMTIQMTNFYSFLL